MNPNNLFQMDVTLLGSLVIIQALFNEIDKDDAIEKQREEAIENIVKALQSGKVIEEDAAYLLACSVPSTQDVIDNFFESVKETLEARISKHLK